MENKIEYKKVYITEDTENGILDFINENYKNTDGLTEIQLFYSLDLFKYYLMKDYVAISFYIKEKMIGFIAGSKRNIYIRNKKVQTIDVNFLCIVPEMRGKHITTHMKNILIQECIKEFKTEDIYSGIYTVGRKLQENFYSSKEYYHRPINICKLLDVGFLSGVFENEVIQKVYNGYSYNKNNFLLKTLKYYNENEN